MKYKGFSKKELKKVYSLIYSSRKLDEKQLVLLKQGKGFFHIGASGHEAVQVAAGLNIKTGSDFSYPYYREQAYCLTLGMTVEELFLAFLAKKNDPSSAGRQMPMHYGHSELNIVSQSSPTGTQYLQAVGTAFAMQRYQNGNVVYVSSGDGTTSQGDFHEALNWASREKAPVIFHIENNHYAISVPLHEQVANGQLYDITSGYDNLGRYNINGTDFFESHLAFKKAVDRARRGKGPSVIVSDVVRLLPHSSSDDHRKYRNDKDLNNDKNKDPISIFEKICIDNNILTKKDINNIQNKIKSEIDTAALWAQSQDVPDSNTANKFLFSLSDNLSYGKKEIIDNQQKIVMVDSINHALDEELSNNEKMLIYGQDIADGKGGVFTATKGLSSKYGNDRVFNAPLAESSIVGTAIGLAICGYKPVVEIQFGDYIWTAMMQIRNELATMRYRSNNNWKCPVVIRVPVGGYIHGGLCHSQSIEGYFAHLPGIKIAYPSNAADAKGLLKSACRMNDPVLFLEHKGLYRQGYASSYEPDNNYLLEFGKAKIVKEGNQLTIISWGAIVEKAIQAVNELNVDAEIIDIRTINPLDLKSILNSVKKTNRVIIAHEDNLTNGFGGEIASKIVENAFEFLDAPIKRVASKDYPVPYADELEKEILVQTSWIEKAIEEILEY
ncbi:MAG: tungsten formylmethanofuran dehydrogenase [Candidatus Marinimicrobia bacterium]|nr:tungsten formylmethanofuran dehydrogenase [Candidatus Neomarinimicrobiota bacterium]